MAPAANVLHVLIIDFSPVVQAGFRVSPVTIEKTKGTSLIHAVGTLTNVSERQRFGVQIHFDLDHQGTAGGFTFEVRWAGTALVHRDAVASDARITGRVEAAILATGAQLSVQSWGAVLPFSASVAGSADAYAGGLTIDFQANPMQAGDTVTLRNYTVVRLP